MAVARSARRTAGKFTGTTERTYDGYPVPDNVTISGPGVMVGPRAAPAAGRANIDSTIMIQTHLPLVGTWEDGAEEWGLLGQVINPAALAQPNTIFWVLEQCERTDWQCREDPGAYSALGGTQIVSAIYDGEVPPDYPYADSEGADKIFLMRKGTDVGYDVSSNEAIGMLVQHGITLIHHARNFDWSSNQVWITEDCMGVMIGRRFWTDMAMEAPSLAEALAIPGNSALGFADYLYSQGGSMEDPQALATIIIQQIDPDCAPSGQYEAWMGPIKGFHEWLVKLVYEDVLGINFPGG